MKSGWLNKCMAYNTRFYKSMEMKILLMIFNLKKKLLIKLIILLTKFEINCFFIYIFFPFIIFS